MTQGKHIADEKLIFPPAAGYSEHTLWTSRRLRTVIFYRVAVCVPLKLNRYVTIKKRSERSL